MTGNTFAALPPVPTSIVIGKDGRTIYAESNFYWASPEKLLAAVPKR